jgi:hypothetical protein
LLLTWKSVPAGEAFVKPNHQLILPEKQRATRQWARSRGVNPDVADLIGNQALGAKAVKEMGDLQKKVEKSSRHTNPFRHGPQCQNQFLAGNTDTHATDTPSKRRLRQTARAFT